MQRQRGITGASRDVPGPSGIPFLGALPELRKNPLEFLVHSARTYGDVVKLGGVGKRGFYLVSHPDDIHRIVKANHRNYVKGANFQLIKALAGDGLFLSENDHWVQQRKLIQPAFHMARLGAMAGSMVQHTETMLDRWDRSAAAGEPVDVELEMNRLSLNIGVRVLFGADVEHHADDIREAVTTVFAFFHQRVWTPGLPLWVPTPANREFKRAVGRLDEIVYRIIEQRRRSGEERDDVLSMLLGMRDEDGQGMTDRQLRDEVMTLLVAGHESTALTLTWTLYLISHYPMIEQRLHRELDRVLEGDRLPELGDFGQLTYLTQVLRESMRLYPAFWVFTRTPKEDDVLGGYRIPAGSVLLISCFVTHRDRRFWRNPEGVDPDRFSEERTRKRPEFAYYPFGGGPRRCVGQRLAELEALMVLATISRRTSLHLVPGRPVVPTATLSLRPDGGLPMTVHPRRVPAPAPVPDTQRETVAIPA